MRRHEMNLNYYLRIHFVLLRLLISLEMFAPTFISLALSRRLLMCEHADVSGVCLCAYFVRVAVVVVF